MQSLRRVRYTIYSKVISSNKNLAVKLVFSAICVFLSVQTAYAAVSCNINTNSCSGPMKEIVTAIIPTKVGDMLFTAPAAIQSLQCNAQGGGQNFLLRSTHGTFDATVAVALLAESANRNVTLKRDSADNDCVVFFLRLGF